MTQLTLIIISYNSYDILKQCQDELLKSGKYRIIIVDNSSTDGSADRLNETYPDVEIVALNHNIGYGRAANIGIGMTRTPYAFVINPDLYATSEVVGEILSEVEANKGKAALFSPAVKSVNFTQTGLEERNWISGAAMLFDLEEMQEIGFFDEQIFLFSEESDLCYRTIQSGKKILLLSDIYLKHLKGQACLPSPAIVQLKGWHFGWSRSYFRAKHQMDHGKRSPFNQLLRYRYKALTARDKMQRLKYKSRVAGMKAFQAGTPAFDQNGIASQSTLL